jgi:hypothetical protein
MAKKQPSRRRGLSPKLEKLPKKLQDPVSYDAEYFLWRINDSYIDYEHPELGWANIDVLSFLRNVVKTLQSYEGLTWNEVKNKPHCHSQEVIGLPTKLQTRLMERNLDVDDLFQISIGSICRLWGYRELKTFYLMWYDSKHQVLKTEAK